MKNKVKVLEFLPGLNYGGAQAMIVNLCRNIDYDRVQCDFVIDHENLLDMKELVESFGAQVHIMPSYTGSNLSDVKAAWEKFFEENDYDIIHSHVRSYSSIILKIAKKHGLKTIIHSHNTSNGKGIGSLIRTVLQLPLRTTCDYFFSCSKEAGEWLFGKRITKSDRFFVVNNAIETDDFVYDEKIRNEYRNQFGLKDEKVFIQVGRMSAQKNYLFTLDVFKKYLLADSEAKLFIVGDGELEEQIRAKIEELKFGDSVVVLQRRDDVNCLLQMADIFLMPSLYEGLSVAAVEAQASGIRCLLSDKCDQNVNITGLCEFLPLEEERWIEALKADIGLRVYTKEAIVKAGFDVRNTAKWLQKFYLEIVK